jgi:tRNA wybutosine-synthesizing protein 3
MGEGSTNDLYSFDTTTSAWSRVHGKGTPPAPRSFHAMVAVGTALYVFGGCGTSGRLSDLHRFDTKSGQWTQLPSSDTIVVRMHACRCMHPA